MIVLLKRTITLLSACLITLNIFGGGTFAAEDSIPGNGGVGGVHPSEGENALSVCVPGEAPEGGQSGIYTVYPGKNRKYWGKRIDGGDVSNVLNTNIYVNPNDGKFTLTKNLTIYILKSFSNGEVVDGRQYGGGKFEIAPGVCFSIKKHTATYRFDVNNNGVIDIYGIFLCQGRLRIVNVGEIHSCDQGVWQFEEGEEAELINRGQINNYSKMLCHSLTLRNIDNGVINNLGSGVIKKFADCKKWFNSSYFVCFDNSVVDCRGTSLFSPDETGDKGVCRFVENSTFIFHDNAELCENSIIIPSSNDVIELASEARLLFCVFYKDSDAPLCAVNETPEYNVGVIKRLVFDEGDIFIDANVFANDVVLRAELAGCLYYKVGDKVLVTGVEGAAIFGLYDNARLIDKKLLVPGKQLQNLYKLIS